MAETPATPSSAPQLLDEDAPLCPVCGYDLRGTTGERCSECGEVIDWQALKTSGFPWARRKEIGRIRAYIQTVWLVTIDSKRLRHEASTPQDLKDARSFRRVTASILAVVFLSVFTAAIWKEGLGSLAFQPMPFMATMGRVPSWLQDLAVPWSAGATIPVTLPAILILLAADLTGLQRALFRVKDASPARQQRLAAIALYAAAPTAWLLAAALDGLVIAVFQASVGPNDALMAVFALAVLLEVLVIVAALASIARIVQWAVRVRHAGLERGLLALIQLLALWLIGFATLLGIVPWCVGFLWIIVDSFR
jgi:hypothetical protein